VIPFLIIGKQKLTEGFQVNCWGWSSELNNF